MKLTQCHLILLMMSWKMVCQALSLPGISVEPDDLKACHCMRKKDWVIIKDRILSNRKVSQNKSLDLTQSKFSTKLFVNESMCHENHQLSHKCRRLESARKIYSTWFYSRTLYIKLVENGLIHKISYPADI